MAAKHLPSIAPPPPHDTLRALTPSGFTCLLIFKLSCSLGDGKRNRRCNGRRWRRPDPPASERYLPALPAPRPAAREPRGPSDPHPDLLGKSEQALGKDGEDTDTPYTVLVTYVSPA
ncbi:uncharacterized protein LJ206_005313 isoform 1-T1 [Theristicus caerulescens]